ncbi:saxitoxin and tetrodotoxin-binding protein 1-like [Embiotoca jacksoni]|uniref:saxitoxin and tetrodotoxin-binding protein 1-like n=1 Tax=Embiotoca jacksoni TaxID=100190 RepID=UPI0037044B39
MLAVYATILLCLMSVSLSAPLACEDLVQPVSQLDPQHLEGRWVLVAGSLSYLPFMERLRHRDSSSAHFSSNAGEDNISFSRSMRSDNECYSSSYNISLEGSSFTFDNGSVTTTFIRTSCPDCILLSCDVDNGKRQHFYLFSKRRQLEQKEMEEFRAQVECLNMPPPVVMDPTKELCPEEMVSEPALQTEEKAEGQKN